MKLSSRAPACVRLDLGPNWGDTGTFLLQLCGAPRPGTQRDWMQMAQWATILPSNGLSQECSKVTHKSRASGPPNKPCFKHGSWPTLSMSTSLLIERQEMTEHQGLSPFTRECEGEFGGSKPMDPD